MQGSSCCCWCTAAQARRDGICAIGCCLVYCLVYLATAAAVWRAKPSPQGHLPIWSAACHHLTTASNHNVPQSYIGLPGQQHVPVPQQIVYVLAMDGVVGKAGRPAAPVPAWPDALGRSLRDVLHWRVPYLRVGVFWGGIVGWSVGCGVWGVGFWV